MEELYIVTGADGHLGNAIMRKLEKQGKMARGLVFSGGMGHGGMLPAGNGKISYMAGDVRDKATLEPLFHGAKTHKTIVIHGAGIIDIRDVASRQMVEVNVGGTKNVAELSMAHQVSRMVYVSSVHAIPEKGKLRVLDETHSFSPDWVVGGYAKTKAAATRLVLDMAKEGLPAVVVHPSGMLGPYDRHGNHLVQLVKAYMENRLPACVKGGYDFVDVRDVADGCLAAGKEGRIGECYILSNRHYQINELLSMVRQINGGRRIPAVSPRLLTWTVPFLEWQARRKKGRPLYTRYSLYTLGSNVRFSHHKATSQLGYRPRDLYLTLEDTVAWLRS